MNAADIRPPDTWELTNPMYAFRYARYVVKGRWPEGELVIKQHIEWACEYAYRVLGSRWPEVESLISQHPMWATFYAKYIIKGRWPEAEEVIAKSDWKDGYLADFPEVAEDWVLAGWLDWLDT